MQNCGPNAPAACPSQDAGITAAKSPEKEYNDKSATPNTDRQYPALNDSYMELRPNRARHKEPKASA